jgi:uncharacterized Fe-S cluster protein YjdI
MQEYRNDNIIIRYDETICIHAGNCVKNLPAVFDSKKRPWINVDGADVEAIKNTIALCPSGALSFEMVQGKDSTSS